MLANAKMTAARHSTACSMPEPDRPQSPTLNDGILGAIGLAIAGLIGMALTLLETGI